MKVKIKYQLILETVINNGWSQSDLAKRYGGNQSIISRILAKAEKGEPVTTQTAHRLAGALGLQDAGSIIETNGKAA